MSTILVVTTVEYNEKSRRNERLVSHGINMETDEVVVMPCEPVERSGAVFDSDLGEYVIREESPRTSTRMKRA